jgi:hypothetical protein
MTALTAHKPETGPVISTEPTECENLLVTTSSGHFQRCANPFCKAVIDPLNGCKWRRTRRRFCSDACKYTFHALKLIKPIVAKVGAVRFLTLMDEV